MFGKTHYHEHVKKYVSLFGTLFNDIWINRENSSGKTRNSFKVPINYGPKEKWLERIQADPDIDKEVAIVLPRMGFEITGIDYDPERKLASTHKESFSISNDDDSKRYVYSPVPYNLTFILSVMAKYQEDGLRIIEQILPNFTPDFTPSFEIISTPQIIRDIPIVLNSVDVEDTYEGSFEERRAIIWNLNFTMKTFFYGRARTQKIITLANTQFFIPDSDTPMTNVVGNTALSERVTVYPGLDANGNPTTNTSLTVDRSLINANDNWTYITEYSGPLTGNT